MIFDEKSLRERLLDDDVLINRVLQSFISAMPDHISTLKEYIDANDCNAVQHKGHTIKGSAASAGALEIQRIALNIENAGRNHELQQAKVLVGPLTSAFENFKSLF